MCVHECVCTWVCVHECVCVCVCVYMSVCVCTWVCVYMCVCVWVYMYVCVCTSSSLESFFSCLERFWFTLLCIFSCLGPITFTGIGGDRDRSFVGHVGDAGDDTGVSLCRRRWGCRGSCFSCCCCCCCWCSCFSRLSCVSGFSCFAGIIIDCVDCCDRCFAGSRVNGNKVLLRCSFRWLGPTDLIQALAL